MIKQPAGSHKKEEVTVSKSAEMTWRMPAEWEPHEATWIAWPHNRDDWPGKFPAIPWVYCEIVRHLRTSERVNILVNDEEAPRRVRRRLRRTDVALEGVSFHTVPTDRVWLRDSGPLFVTRDEAGFRELVLTGWGFNAWAKYPNWQKDCLVPHHLYKILNRPLVVVSTVRRGMNRTVVLEGGCIDVNGLGCLLATEECLLSKVQQRNPH
ncbi:MAG TPA: agmatine deiminase family protein, partial [Gemmataceae bacterium]|nr:agmatine deiminase family protein [Gemmataceae bacterium]